MKNDLLRHKLNVMSVKGIKRDSAKRKSLAIKSFLIFGFAFFALCAIFCPQFTGHATGAICAASFMPVGMKHFGMGQLNDKLFKDDPDKDDDEKKGAALIEKINKSIGEKYPFLKDSEATLKAIKDIQEKMAKIKTEDDYEAFKKASKETLEDLGAQVKALAEKAKPQDNSFAKQISNWLEEKKDDLKSLYKNKGTSIELELKVVGDIGLGSGSIQSPVPQFPIWGTPDFNLIGTFIENYISVSATGMPAFPYTEMLPKDGDFSFLAEGATKPEIDFKWETRYVTPQKTAAWERLSEEVMADVPRIQSLANSLLLKKHNIKKQRAIISGNGVSPTPKGMIYYGRHFNASNVPAVVTAPNIFDVINACVVDIATTHNYTDEMPYTATFVGLHPIDYFTYIQSTKDQDNRPMFNYEALKINNSSPQITNAWSGNAMNSVIIVPTLEIPIGTILVCDASKYNLVNYIPYTVRIGWINDDFIKNQFVILAESRFFTFVKKLDEQAFIYDNIDTIMDAIEGTIS